MDERLTDEARTVMRLAKEEARRRNHEYIGTEHILLGLLEQPSGIAAKALHNLGVDLPIIASEVEKIIQPGPANWATVKPVPTPRAKKVIEYSVEEARNLNHNYVGTEHLLLGLLREQESVAAQLLMDLGLKLEGVRRELLRVLGIDPAYVKEPEEENDDEGRPAWEYDLYVPLRYNDGSPIEEEKINQIKVRLTEKFAAIRFSTQPNPGTWNIGYATFRNEIIVCHVFVEDELPEFFQNLKEELKSDLKQEDILIVRRKVWLL